jgi:hypothetical protein
VGALDIDALAKQTDLVFHIRRSIQGLEINRRTARRAGVREWVRIAAQLLALIAVAVALAKFALAGHPDTRELLKFAPRWPL